MATDEDKAKLCKLLQDIEVPEVKLTERCSDLVKDFKQRFGKDVDTGEDSEVALENAYENPYKVDQQILGEINRKLKELLKEGKRMKKESADNIILNRTDPKRPWRTNSSKEKLVRIDNEIKRHLEKANDKITPLSECDMKELVQECQEETLAAPSIATDKLVSTVQAAKKNLPNFQYRKVENTTATSIFPEAHQDFNEMAAQQNENVVLQVG